MTVEKLGVKQPQQVSALEMSVGTPPRGAGVLANTAPNITLISVDNGFSSRCGQDDIIVRVLFHSVGNNLLQSATKAKRPAVVDGNGLCELIQLIAIACALDQSQSFMIFLVVALLLEKGECLFDGDERIFAHTKFRVESRGKLRQIGLQADVFLGHRV